MLVVFDIEKARRKCMTSCSIEGEMNGYKYFVFSICDIALWILTIFLANDLPSPKSIFHYLGVR